MRFYSSIAIVGLLALVLSAPTPARARLTANSLTANALTHNGISVNSLTANAIQQNGLSAGGALDDLNGVAVEAVVLPEN